MVSYHLLEEQFGVGLSTVGWIVIEVCFAMELKRLARTMKLGEVGRVHLGGLWNLDLSAVICPLVIVTCLGDSSSCYLFRSWMVLDTMVFLTALMP